MQGRRRRPGVGRQPVQRLEERHKEPELIRGRADVLPVELLGRHVARRAHRPARRREGRVGPVRFPHRVGHVEPRRGGPGKPEVGHSHDSVVADEHVGRLEVPVDHPRRMGSGQPPPRRDEHVDDGIALPLTVDEPLRQVDAGHELHGDVCPVGELAGVVHGHHVGVGQPRERPRLPEQRIRSHRVALGAGPHHLHRDLAIELRVVRRVDGPHRPRPDPLEEEIRPHAGGLFGLAKQLAGHPMQRPALIQRVPGRGDIRGLTSRRHDAGDGSAI